MKRVATWGKVRKEGFPCVILYSLEGGQGEEPDR